MGKAAGKRPMTGFKKITFDENGTAGAASAPYFESRGLVTQQTNENGSAASAAAVLQKAKLQKQIDVLASPALSCRSNISNLSVDVNAKKSPTFNFQPYSGYGNTEPPPFSLGGPDEEAPTPDRSKKFFGGGSPTWILDGWTFALSATGVKQDELLKLIERNGGSVSRVMSKKVDLLVATAKAVKRNTQRVRKATLKGVGIVTPEFIHDSLKAGEALDPDDYVPPPPTPRVASKSSGAASASSSAPFKWRRAIRSELQAAGGTMRRRKLRKKVLKLHLDCLDAKEARSWRAKPTEHKALFREKLRHERKMGQVSTEGRQVSLA